MSECHELQIGLIVKYPNLSRGVFKTQSNLWNEDFCKKLYRRCLSGF